MIVLGAATVLKAGQATDPQASVIQGVPAVLPGTPVPPPEAPPDVLWTKPIAAAPVTSPLLTGEHVVIAHSPGVIVAHRVLDGELVWKSDLNPEQPLVADATTLFVASGEAIHALRLTDGTVAWRAPAGALTAPLLAKGGWVVAATAGKLTTLRASDGSTVWSADAPLQREAAAISGNTLFVPSTDGYMRAFDLGTGKRIWEQPLAGQPAEPVVIGDRVLFGAADKAFYSLSATSGEQHWRFAVGASIRGRAASDGERVYFTALDNVLRAHDFRNGSQKWARGLRFRPLAGPVVAGGTIFVSGPNNEILMFRTLSGSPAGAVTFPAKLAVGPGMRESDYGVAVAAITGGLEESWNLLITRPVRAIPVTLPTRK